MCIAGFVIQRSFLAERISNVIPYADGSSCVLPFELLFASLFSTDD